jgi:transposase InsO family protein
VIFDKNVGKVVDQNKRTVLVADRVNELYYLRDKTPTCNIVTKNNKERKSLEIWHRRMGHLNARDLVISVRNGKVRGVDLIVPREKIDCEVCILGKMTRTPFPKNTDRKSELLEIVHSDVCGPMRIESNGNARYFVTFIDDFSKWCEIRLLKKKDEVFKAFEEYKASAEKRTGKSIKYLQSDNGKEFRNERFDAFLKEHGIGRRLTVTNNPEQNGVAERRNRTLVEMARCLLIQSGLPSSFWGEAVNTANYIRNRCPSNSLNGETAYQKWTGDTPDVSHLREFGCSAYTLNRSQNKGKFADRSRKGVLVGYSDESKAYRV